MATSEIDIPLTEIPETLRSLHEEWAIEVTRANRLERLLRSAEESAADWQRIALDNGSQLVRCQVDLARAEDHANRAVGKLSDAEAKLRAAEYRASQSFQRADTLAEHIMLNMEHNGESVDDQHINDLIESAGVECIECDGRGSVADEQMIGDPSDKYGHRTRPIVVDCGTCHGLGRTLR